MERREIYEYVRSENTCTAEVGRHPHQCRPSLSTAVLETASAQMQSRASLSNKLVLFRVSSYGPTSITVTAIIDLEPVGPSGLQ